MKTSQIMRLSKMPTKNEFKFVPFSFKQKQILTWWMRNINADGIIADGSIRSGKTIIMSLSYCMWAMETFNNEVFGMAGKTIGSFKRNVLFKLKTLLKNRGYEVEFQIQESLLTVRNPYNGNINYFYIFGGKYETSQDSVQGLTCAGFFFDEVTLMPESFVNQCIARCSVEGAKYWFDCNAGGPFHYFKTDFIDKFVERKLIRIKFSLDDNPSLTNETKERYKRNFSGLFYSRYIDGEWVMAEGIIYSMFRSDMIIDKLPFGVRILTRWVGVDYGQSNATTFILCGLGTDNKLYILDEFYHEGKSSQVQKSPKKYAEEFKKWIIKCGVDGSPVRHERIYIDPSAKGFLLQLNEEGIKNIRQADNEVARGIELIASIIDSDSFRVFRKCTETIKEMASYRWDEKAQLRGIDTPIKQYDHCLDAIRYVCNGTRLIWQRLVA